MGTGGGGVDILITNSIFMTLQGPITYSGLWCGGEGIYILSALGYRKYINSEKTVTYSCNTTQ
jgi:hypothetical protein